MASASASASAAAAAAGRRLFSEIEETDLEEVFLPPILSEHLDKPSIRLTNESSQVLSSLRATLLYSTAARPSDDIGTDTEITAAAVVSTANSKLKVFPIPALDGLVVRHFRATQVAPLVVSGRQLPLLYVLVATLIAVPHRRAVVIIDAERRFDITRVLQCTPYTEVSTGATADSGDQADDPNDQPDKVHAPRVTVEDLSHVHVFHAIGGSRGHIANVVASAARYMLYGPHQSRSREWWGTVIIGGEPADDAAVATGWRGWLRVDREEAHNIGPGLSIEEALGQRAGKASQAAEGRWTARSVWGSFEFSE